MHPILFHINNFYIGTYGLFIVGALLGGIGLGKLIAMRLGRDFGPYYDLAFVVLIAAFPGARLLFILLNFDEFLKAPLSMIFAREGFVFLGGFISAVVAGIIFLRSKNLPIWDTGDFGAPCLALGHAIGRVGCFAAGCCYGRPVDPDFAFLGVSFPLVHKHTGEPFLSFAYYDHLYRGLISPDAVASLPVYPTQLFEVAINLVICGVLLFAWTKRKFSGQIFIYYLWFYGAARFGIEFLRGDLARGIFFDGLLSTSQILGLAAIGVGTVLWFILRDKSPLVGAQLATSK